MIQRTLDSEINLVLGKLNLSDELRDYQNKFHENFISSQDKNESELLKVKVIMISNEHPNYKKCDTSVDVYFGTLSVNFKSDTVVAIMKFLQSAQPNQQQIIKEKPKEIQQSPSRDRRSTQLEEDVTKISPINKRQSTLMEVQALHQQQQSQKENQIISIKLKLVMKRISIILIHRKTHLQVCEARLENSEIGFIQKKKEMEASVQLGNLQLIDFTNYPYTLYKESQWKDAVPRQILGVANSQNSLLDIGVKMFNADHPDIKNFNAMIVKINVSAVKLDLMMQPIFRIMDVALAQTLASILTPEIFDNTLNKSTMETVEYNPLKGQTDEQIQNQINKPSFMDIKISITQPIITIKTHSDSQDYIQINLGFISIESANDCLPHRIIKDQYNDDDSQSDDQEISNTWCQYYNIKMKQMEVQIVKNGNIIPISNQYEFNLSVEMPMFLDQYKYLYPSLKFDNKLIIRCRILPVIMKIRQADFLFIMKVLFGNISYDDKLDCIWIHDYKKLQAIQQKMEPGSIDFKLDIDNMSLFTMSESLNENNQIIPFARISIDQFRVIFKSSQNGMEVALKGKKMDGSFYQQNKQQLIEGPLLGCLFRQKEHNIDQIQNIFDELRESSDQNPEPFTFTQFPQKENLNLDFELQMPSTGGISLQVNISDITINLEVKFLLQLSSFGIMDDSVTPMDPMVHLKDATDIEFDDGPIKKIVPQTDAETVMLIGIKNVIFQIPFPNAKEVLAARGQIRVSIIMRQSRTLDSMLQEINIQKVKYEETYFLNEVMKLNLQMIGLEVFICDFDQLVIKDFKQVKKRNLFCPFSLFLNMGNYMPLNEKHYFTNYQKLDINMETVALRLSIKDLNLISNTVNYQISQLLPADQNQDSVKSTESTLDQTQIQDEENDNIKEKSQEEILLEITQGKMPGDTIQLNDFKLSFILYNFQIIVINDSSDALLPVLEIEFHEIKNIMTQNFCIMVNQLIFNMSISYFNPQNSRWEPVIEPVPFQVDVSSNQFVSPKFLIDVNMLDEDVEFNLNISTQLLNVLVKAMNSLTDDGNKYVNQATQLIQDEKDKVENVSPYRIQNLTGYPIRVEKDLSLSHQKVAPQKDQTDYIILNVQETINYQIEQDLDDIFTEIKENDLQNIYLVKFKILSDRLPNAKYIEKINLDRYMNFHSITTDDPSQNFVCLCAVDVENDRKVLRISSPLLFENLTELQIKIIVLQNGGQHVDFELPQFDKFSIPVDLVKSHVQLKINDDYSTNIVLEKVTNAKNDTDFEIKIGNYIVLLHIFKESGCLGRTIVKLKPMYIIKNCLPVNVEYRIFNQSMKEPIQFKLTPQQQFFENTISHSQKLFFQAKIQGFSWSNETMLYQRNSSTCHSVVVYDIDKNELNISVNHPEGFTGSKSFYFYVPTYILNKTGLDLCLFSLENDLKKKQPTPRPIKEIKKIAGQSRLNQEENKNDQLTLMGNQPNILFSDARSTLKTSDVFKLVNLGVSFMDLPTKDGVLEIGVSNNLNCVDNDYYIHTKEIVVTPKLIVVNNTAYQIILKQEKTEQKMVFEPNTRKPYFWQSNEMPKKILMNVNDKIHAKDYLWSSQIDISSVGVINYCLRCKNDNNQQLFVRIDSIMNGSVQFIVFNQTQQNQEGYIIQNKCKNTSISYYQHHKDLVHTSMELPPNSLTEFAWDQPQENREIKVIFSKEHFYSQNAIIQIDKINQSYQIKLRNLVNAQQIANVHVETIAQGNTKKLIFSDKKDSIDLSQTHQQKTFLEKKDTNKQNQDNKKGQPEQNQQPILAQYSVNFPKIGISIINNYKCKNHEFLFITVQSLELAIIEIKETRTVQLRVQYLNIDNNSTNLTLYPVVMTPKNFKSLYVKKDKYLLNLIFEQSKSSAQNTILNFFKFEMEPISLKVEETFVIQSISYFSSLKKALNYQQDIDLKMCNKEVTDIYPFFWIKDQIPEPIGGTYIDMILLSPIIMNLTYKSQAKNQQNNNTNNDSLLLFNMFIKAVGATLANIDDAPIKLRGFKLFNCFDSIGGIISKMIANYQTDFVQNALKLVGSVDVIGNPVGLFSNIGNGVIDLYEKPAEGFGKGPLEGVQGIGKGAGSLVKNITAGAFNSVNKITGSVGTGMAALTLDDDFQKQREQMKMKKAKGVVDGFGQAGQSLFKGVAKGIQGVFTKPLEGAKKGGIKGFGKGMVQGITGFSVMQDCNNFNCFNHFKNRVFKPVAGVLDATSKTAEGIKSQAEYFDDKPNEQRQRIRRVFYGPEKFYKVYDEGDAEVQQLLFTFNNGKYGANFFLDTLTITPNPHVEDDKYFLIITAQHLIYLGLKKKQLLWEINCSNILSVDKFSDSVQINLKQSVPQYQDKIIQLVIHSTSMRNQAYDKIIELLDIQSYMK